MKKTVVLILALVLGLATCVPFYGCAPSSVNDKWTIVLDGGGHIGNYNTTKSMIKSDANPFPYNTLETLTKEWMKLHPEYKVIVNSTSYGGNVSSLRPLLKVGTAPDVVLMSGTTAEEELGTGNYLALNEYLNKPNPYAPEYETWLDLYHRELDYVSDGSYLYVNMERQPVGIVYNERLLKAAGVTKPDGSVDEPVTYSQLKEAQRKVYEYAKTSVGKGKYAYLTPYRWHDIVLECNMFGHLIPELDALIKDGKVNTEELIRGYTKGIWTPESEKYKAYLKLVADRCEYFPKDFANITPLTQFVQGNCAFMEADGATLRQISANKNVNFEYKLIPYPTLDKSDLEAVGIDPDIVPEVKNVRRGLAGYASSWGVTRTAINKGKETCDAIADLLMFLTAPAQNDRMVGDLGGGIPLNPQSADVVPQYLRPLYEIYDADSKNEDLLRWAAVNSISAFGTTFESYYLSLTYSYIGGTKTLDDTYSALTKNIKNLVVELKDERGYDTTLW